MTDPTTTGAIAPSRWRRMQARARRLAPVVASTAPGERAPWLAALIGPRRRVLPALAHFPKDDCIDRASGSQLFLHAHDPTLHGFAHIHVFLRAPQTGSPRSPKTPLTHIAAIELDTLGWPTRLLALNQWVTAEQWLPARKTLALAQQLDFTGTSREAQAARAFTDLLAIHWPELRDVLEARDRRLQRALDRAPGTNVLLDRALEIVAQRRIDSRRRLKALAPDLRSTSIYSR